MPTLWPRLPRPAGYAATRYASLRHSQPHVEQPPQGVLGKHAEKVAPQPLEQPLGGKKLTLVEFSGIDVS